MNRVAKLAEKKRLRVVGLMSGTSADGVDAAIVDIEESGGHGLEARETTARMAVPREGRETTARMAVPREGRGTTAKPHGPLAGMAVPEGHVTTAGPYRVNLLAFEVFAYPPALRRQVLRLCEPASGRVDDICHYNFVLGELFGEAVSKVCERNGIAMRSIDLIGSHGQTIYHSPKPKRFGGRAVRSTLQIGEPSVIAERTGITTVADFRPRDMAAGGQGAPLVPYSDYILFNHKHLSRAIQNIGGIANVTYLPACCRQTDVVAFDTGPGNMVIDRIVGLAAGGGRRYDAEGRMAARGSVDARLLGELLRHPFFRRVPPKSTGREEFGFAYADRIYEKARKDSMHKADIAATVTAFTAVSIAQAYRRFLPAMPDEVSLCGGGAHNATLVDMLQRELGDIKIRKTDEFGISVDAKEAVSFAVLAYASIKGLPGNIPSATGAERGVVLGKIVPA
ncbi:MAG: anhydro-N-acetylmuramic acid kinase [Sedimentisphaerales bacterium]|nr:anhydro-N-acetylmuramic acid kinase [Sedimentisphaerales bacterium]